MNIEKKEIENRSETNNRFSWLSWKIKWKIDFLVKDWFNLDSMRKATKISILSILWLISSYNIAQAERDINGIFSYANADNISHFNLCHSNQSTKDTSKWTCENIWKTNDSLNPGYFKWSISWVPNEDNFLAFQAVDYNWGVSDLSNPLYLWNVLPNIQDIQIN